MTLISLSLAFADTRSFDGATAAAVLERVDGCDRTIAWIWAAEDLGGAPWVLLSGGVWDTCARAWSATFSGEAPATFTASRRSATLSASVPVDGGDLAIEATWRAGSESGRADLSFDWGAWTIDYPSDMAWREATATGTLDGAAAEGTWAYLYRSGEGTVTP